MKKLTLYLTLTFFLTACQNPTYSLLSKKINEVAQADVLLVSDHTLPEHLNMASGGANGEERRFIDPTIKSLKRKLESKGLQVQVLNVEQMITSGDIRDEQDFNLAYANYDKVLEAAVNSNLTILSIHYDANIIPAEQMGTADDYVGGGHVILDQRTVSDETLKFANQLIVDAKVLEQLNQTGLRLRPDYETQIRYQNNLTLNIVGASKGGAALLEIGAQEQAQALFGSPEQIVEAIDGPLATLANTIVIFRNNLVN